MKFGILSTADIGTEYVIPAIQASEHEATAIASRDDVRAEAVAANFGIERSYGSYADLLADRTLDAVYNPLPNALHVEWSRAAAAEGLHVLCEKPLTADTEKASALFDYCEECGVTLMEAFMYKFHPRTERALKIVQEELGDVRYVDSTFTIDLGPVDYDLRLDPDMAGGALMDVGCYAVSAARAFLGEPNRAYAFAADTYDAGVDSQLAGTLEYADGAVAHVTGGFDTPETQRYRVLAEDGWLEASDCFFLRDEPTVSLTWAVDGEERTETFDPVDQYRLEVEAFADAVVTGREPRVDRADTLGNVRVIDALYANVERGTRVDVI